MDIGDDRALVLDTIAGYDEAAPQVRDTVNAWLARGDGVAVYENRDMGHRDIGTRVLLSYGSPAAQLAVATPPLRCPDMEGHALLSIGWRYVLIGTYKGETL